METAGKITVEVPQELLEKAQEASGPHGVSSQPKDASALRIPARH